MRLAPILALLILLAAVQVNAQAGGVGVYLDFGDGRVVWGQVPWHENITAFEATFELLNETGLSWNYSVTQYGVFVNSIGGLENRWPGPWWHLYSLEGGSWSLSQVSCDSLTVEEGGSVAWAYYQDAEAWPNSTAPSVLPPWTPFWYSSNSSRSGPLPDLGSPSWSVHLSDWGVQTTPAVVEGRLVVNSWGGAVVLDPESGELLARVNGTYGLAQPTGYGQYFLLGGAGWVGLFRLDGTEVWRLDIGGETFAGAALAYAGTFYFGTANFSGGPSHLYAVAANGTILWSLERSESSYFSSPAAMGDKIVFPLAGVYDPANFTFHDGGILLVNASSGEILGSLSGYSVSCRPLVIGNSIYFTSREGYLVKALVGDGLSVVWRVNVKYSTSSPVLTDYGILVGWGSFSLSRGGLVMVDQDGRVLWRAIIGPVQSNPVVIGGDVVAVSVNSQNGTVFLISVSDEGASIIQSYELGNYVLSSPAYSNGWLFVGCDDGMVYAFGPGAAVPEMGSIAVLLAALIVFVLLPLRRKGSG